MKDVMKVLGAVFIAGFLLAGCCDDEYYCDDSGCFYCDGFGCRDADHGYPECTFGYECAEGEVCTELGCVAAECVVDEDCPAGTVCRPDASGGGTLCLEPDDEVPIERPDGCGTDRDCGDAGEFCGSDGECHADDGTSCDEDHACEEGMICVEATCVEGGGDADADGDVDGDVDADADADGDVDGDADSDPPPPQCRSNLECEADRGSGWECVDGLCKLPCEDDWECGIDCHCGGDGYCTDPPDGSE
jgi:hypothetical protein